MAITIAHLQPVVALIAGVLILLMPRLLNFIVAAVLTPPDVLSQCSLAIPLLLLYEGSIWSVKLVERRKAAEDAAAAEAANAKPAE